MFKQNRTELKKRLFLMKVGQNRTVVPERRETNEMSLILLWLLFEGTSGLGYRTGPKQAESK